VTSRPNFRLGFDLTDPNTIPSEVTQIFATHPFTFGSNVKPGTEDVQMLRLLVKVKGNLNAENITQIVLGAKGVAASEVSEARLYYTGDNNVFNTTNLIGTLTSPTTNA